MEQVESRTPGPPTGGSDSAWLRKTAAWASPLLLGACPSSALILADLLPQTGPVAWAPEVLALGASPCLLAVLDVSAGDWRSGNSAERPPLRVLRRLLAPALALIGLISAVNLSVLITGIDSNGSGQGLGWLLLLACTTVICTAFITRPDPRNRSGAGAAQGILAWIGFCLPLVVVLGIDAFAPPVASPFQAVAVFFYFALLTSAVVAALLLAPLAGILGGALRRE